MALQKELKKRWLEEHFNPALLHFEEETVSRTQEEIERLQSLIEEIAPQNAQSLFVKQLYESELSRLEYMLCAYLKDRMKKVLLPSYFSNHICRLRSM